MRERETGSPGSREEINRKTRKKLSDERKTAEIESFLYKKYRS